MKKRFILFAIVFVLLVLSSSYLIYIFKFKQYDMADKELEEIIKTSYSMELPNGTRLLIKNRKNNHSELVKEFPEERKGSLGSSSKENKISTNAKEKEVSETVDTTTALNTDFSKRAKETAVGGSFASVKSSTSTSSKMADKTTVAYIKGKYEPVVSKFQREIDDKTNQLIDHAKNEYSTKKQKGESAGFAYMYRKYSEALNKLEKQNYMMFDGIMSSLEKGLEANGYHKEYSKSFRDKYDEQTQLRRENVLDNLTVE